MKILCSIAAIFFSLTISAQTKPTVTNSSSFSVYPEKVNNNLLFSWTAVENTDDTYFIEGSKDGKNFKTIGIVWGTSQEMNYVCRFKEKKSKLDAKYKYYRVSRESVGDPNSK